MFYKFYKNYVDIIDSLTLISTEAIDNSMETMVKTISTINNQYKSLQETAKLPTEISN